MSVMTLTVCNEVYLQFKCARRHTHTHLQNELHHFCVDQSMDRLSVHMGDEVTGAKPRLMGGPTVLYML